MARPATAYIVIAAAVLAAGCFEGKADVTLNPDGTGKIVGEMTFQAVGPWAGHRSTTDSATRLNDPETQMKETVSKILKSSRGIEVWKDVSLKRLEDGRIYFKGTAYFENLADVKIWPDDAKTRAAFGPEGDKVLMLVLNRPEDSGDTRRSSRRYTAESLAKRMKSMRLDYREARGPIGLQLSDMKLDLRFLMPGIPDEVRGLGQQGRTLAFSTTGARLLQHMDSLVADNAYLRGMATAGQSLSGRTLSKVLSGKVFSQAGEVWARMTGQFRPKFDFETEVEAAEEGEKEMLIKLGLEEPRSSRSSRSSSKRSSNAEKDDSKEDPSKKDDKRTPRLPMPKKLPSIPAPILPF